LLKPSLNCGGILILMEKNMNLIELSKYLNDEDLAEKYLLEKEILKTWTNCPHCNSDKLGKISRGRIKCYKCKKEWHKRSGSILESLHLADGIFIALLKLFCDGRNITSTQNELGIDIKTVRYLFNLITTKICSIDLSAVKKEQEFVLSLDAKDTISIALFNDKTDLTKYRLYNIFTLSRKREFDNEYNFELVFKELKRNQKSFTTIDRFANYVRYHSQYFRGHKEKEFLHHLLLLSFRFNFSDEDFHKIIVEKLRFF
jgi:transposase-like protein